MVTVSAPLTHRQAEVLSTIRQFVELRGYSPTIREIGQTVVRLPVDVRR